ncbi:MAG: murein biosynthesis integral membrane protein MurJ [Deltaproteobacteria bacterium]|nr:murein biosynthesis integral membrane protein MurJ [Deltaproteobacteria bacterium]
MSSLNPQTPFRQVPECQPGVSESEQGSVSRAAGVVSFFTLLSRILGLVRDMVVARYFGAEMAADAFFVAFRIPNLLRRLFAEGSLTIAFIPVFTETLTRKSKEDALEVARAVLTLLSLILAVVTVLGILLSPWIVRIQAYGFGGGGPKYDLTVLLTRITFPYILLVSVVAFFSGILNSLRHFGAPAAAPIFLNVGIIGATLWISPHCPQPIVGVAVGVLIGGVMQILLQLPWLYRKGVSLAPCWMPGHPAVRRIGLLMVPAVFGSAIYQINQFMGTLLASFLPEGSISWLYYADRLVEFPLGVFAIAISTAALPSLSKQAARKDMEGFKETLSHALRLVFFITIPSMAGLIILGGPIIHLFFERGAFDAFSTLMTAKALLFYSLGLWAFSGVRVMVSAFYAVQDTRTPVLVAAVAMAAHLLFSLLLMGPLRHGGLALALSLASGIQFCLLVAILNRRVGFLDARPILVSAGKSLTASLAMGLVIHFLQGRWLGDLLEGELWRHAVALFGIILVGTAVYFSSARLLRCRELASVKEILGPFYRGLRRMGHHG